MKTCITKNYISLTDKQKFDFILIGIICEKKDYRISMELNKKLEINLSKEDEYSVFNSKRMEDKTFSFYEYTTEDDDRFNLISNKSQKGFLLPELNQIDYLFVVRLLRMTLEENDILNAIKEIPIILGAYKLDATQLKSGENLVF